MNKPTKLFILTATGVKGKNKIICEKNKLIEKLRQRAWMGNTQN